jgi:glycosyltransferase involved in cell wall biosynthesis
LPSRLPRISVVTPSLNQASFLEGNIQSVLDQDYPDFEHIVVDGESTDGTLSVLEGHPHLNWVSEKDRNMTQALNKGFRMATGEVIAWLNTDDRYLPGVFARVAELLEPAGRARVVMGDARVKDSVDDREYVAKGRSFVHDDVVRFWTGPYFLHQPAIFFLRRLLEEEGYLDETLDLAADYELWTRLSRRHTFHYVPEVLAEVIHHEGCLTAVRDPWREEVLQVSRRSWGRKGGLRYYRYWSSWKAHTEVRAAWEDQRDGLRGRALGRLLRAAAARPTVLGWITWWSVLARSLGLSRLVDAVKGDGP